MFMFLFQVLHIEKFQVSFSMFMFQNSIVLTQHFLNFFQVLRAFSTSMVLQEIIGFEGIWGVLVMVVLVYPALWLIPGPDHGHQEAEGVAAAMAMARMSYNML